MIGLFLRGQHYENNSFINIEDIDREENALVCQTNARSCCRGIDIRTYLDRSLRDWSFPGRSTRLCRKNEQYRREDCHLYTSREFRAVLLHRRNSSNIMTGRYKCTIPDNRGNIISLYAWLHNNDSFGKLIIIRIFMSV